MANWCSPMRQVVRPSARSMSNICTTSLPTNEVFYFRECTTDADTDRVGQGKFLVCPRRFPRQPEHHIARQQPFGVVGQPFPVGMWENQVPEVRQVWHEWNAAHGHDLLRRLQ